MTLVTIEYPITGVRVLVIVLVAAVLVVVDGMARPVFCTDTVVITEGRGG